jgi:hypothetical protein
LQAQIVKKGERVIMDVEVTGMPDPTVTWFKDRKPLEQNAISEHSLKQVGNCYKLILENGKSWKRKSGFRNNDNIVRPSESTEMSNKNS